MTHVLLRELRIDDLVCPRVRQKELVLVLPNGTFRLAEMAKHKHY